jgi:hypothetical protein
MVVDFLIMSRVNFGNAGEKQIRKTNADFSTPRCGDSPGMIFAGCDDRGGEAALWIRGLGFLLEFRFRDH